MNVRDLLLRLSQVPLGAEVWIYSDPEGNDFNELAEVSYDPIEELGDEPVVVLFP